MLGVGFRKIALHIGEDFLGRADKKARHDVAYDFERRFSSRFGLLETSQVQKSAVHSTLCYFAISISKFPVLRGYSGLFRSRLIVRLLMN